MAPQKRRRLASSRGLAPGEPLRRNALPNGSFSPWGWVSTDIVDTSEISLDHLLATCGFSESSHPFCRNKYASKKQEAFPSLVAKTDAEGELEDDVIVISDDDEVTCTKKACKGNPNCLNYLGQESWEDEDAAQQNFLKVATLGDNPVLDTREPDQPVGLKNLGATCYANASLQVWFRDLAFRKGVYSCKPFDGFEDKFQESPIFQLQVTFAALQEGTQNVFNPAKLVESLHLRTAEQQDAQEFSKLFMSHLDSEFRKQSLTSVKSLVTNQFRGKQVYNTVCHTCEYRSERATDFLEMEINFGANSTLDDRISALLEEETMSGDNKYLCPQCDSLQDAARFTELRELPPVLHFSLLRFVYDVATMERKKSKHTISFPTVLDMKRYLGSAENRKHHVEDSGHENIYELRGVLLHKGTSAYHGHYEAQVYDAVNEAWYQCNDEVVTQIKALGDKPKMQANKVEDKKHSAQNQKMHVNAKKRQRIESSGDEAEFVVMNNPEHSEQVNTITSKDAYMLIYARRTQWIDGQHTRGPEIEIAPPKLALDVVRSLNAVHDQACEAYDAKQKTANILFRETRKKVMDIYRNWNVSCSKIESVIVSNEVLAMWLSKDCINAALYPPNEAESDNVMTDQLLSPTSSSRKKIQSNDILCVHQALDPTKAQSMKRISQRTYRDIIENTKCQFDPALSPSDVCRACVETIFRERLYEVEHSRLVQEFDKICDTPNHYPGYWISKKWLRDWRLAKPKMHIQSERDPPPDADDFDSHVRCEHGGLSLNTTSRRRISDEATALLKGLFQTWNPLPTDTEACAVCDTLIHISKVDKKEIRKRAEEEKARLKRLYDSAWDVEEALPIDTPCAIVPAQFLRDWKRWLVHPTENPRPERVDNSPFLCEHDMLAFDPNYPEDMDSTLCIIDQSEWDILECMYPVGPLLALQLHFDDQKGRNIYEHAIPVCTDCRLRRKMDWSTAEIIVRFCGQKNESEGGSTRKTSVTYAKKKGARQSKRLRHIKEFGEKRRLTVSKSTTVKDIKVMIQDEFNIPTICQRLHHQNRELDNNTVTVETLKLLVNDILDLREESEVVEIDSDDEDLPARKRRREEGMGFGGTLLGGTIEGPPPSSRGDTPLSSTPQDKACSACTFSNPYDAPLCMMCDNVFI